MNNNDISKQFSKDLLDAVKQILGQGQIDEASTYEKNKQYIEVTHTSGNKKKVPVHPLRVKAALNRYKNDPSTKSARIVSEAEIDPDLEDELKKTRQTTKSVADAKKRYMTKPVKEEAEQLDELSPKTLSSYAKKAVNQSFGKGVAGGAALASSNKETEAEGHKIVNKAVKRMQGAQKAISKLAKEEVEDLDELSSKTLQSYADKSFKAGARAGWGKVQEESDAEKTAKDTKKAFPNVKHLTKSGNPDWKKHGFKDMPVKEGRELVSRKNWGGTMSGVKPARVPATEEVELTQEEIERLNAIAQELDEARGRPPKEGSAAWKARRAAAKDGEEEKSEPRMHIMQQLQRAKLSMHGGSDVKFENGQTHHIKGQHAAKLLDKYAGMKPFEKEAFQKKIGKSHENLKDEL